MKYISTRGNDKVDSFLEAVLQGLAKDGGLFIPEEWPDLSNDFEKMTTWGYRDIAKHIFKNILNDLHPEEVDTCIDDAYRDTFNKPELVDLIKVGDTYFLELYHGKTAAFKDFALSLLPQFMKLAMKKLNPEKEIVILTATSGDTGKAALEGFKNVDKVKIIIYYPTDGVSEVQRRQMITQDGENTSAIGINGNFDDAQRALKKIFSDVKFKEELEKDGYLLSSANSINIGRLLPQIVYYVYMYVKLREKGELKEGELLNVVVPTGNFGDILAGYFAKKIGLPLNNFICASNKNNVLADFFSTGIYMGEREFHKTISPSMDILISSNLERLLFEKVQDSSLISRWMEDLMNKGEYKLTEEQLQLFKEFYGYYLNDEDTLQEIKKVYNNKKYLMDTHTAVAHGCYEKYKMETGDTTKTAILSTASPFKFPEAVSKALEFKSFEDEFKIMEQLSEKTGLEIPIGLQNLQEKTITQRDIIDSNEVKSDLKKRLQGD